MTLVIHHVSAAPLKMAGWWSEGRRGRKHIEAVWIIMINRKCRYLHLDVYQQNGWKYTFMPAGRRWLGTREWRSIATQGLIDVLKTIQWHLGSIKWEAFFHVHSWPLFMDIYVCRSVVYLRVKDCSRWNHIEYMVLMWWNRKALNNYLQRMPNIITASVFCLIQFP